MHGHSIFSGPVHHLLWMLCVLVKTLSHSNAITKTKRLKGCDFALSSVGFKRHHGSRADILGTRLHRLDLRFLNWTTVLRNILNDLGHVGSRDRKLGCLKMTLVAGDFCRLHCSLRSKASLSISVTLVTSPRGYFLEMTVWANGLWIEEEERRKERRRRTVSYLMLYAQSSSMVISRRRRRSSHIPRQHC